MAALQPPCFTVLRETGTAVLREHPASSHVAYLLSANRMLPPSLVHMFLSWHSISPPSYGQCCTVLLVTVCAARSTTAAITTALGNEFTFSFHWQKYRQKLRIMHIASLRVPFYLTDKKMHRGRWELYRR